MIQIAYDGELPCASDSPTKFIWSQHGPSTKLTIGEIATIQRSIAKSITPQEMIFNFLKTKPVENGSIMVSLPSKKDQTKAINKFKSLGYDVEIKKKKQQRLMIPNVPTDITSRTEMIELVKKQNPELLELTNESNSLRLVAVHF